MGIFEAVFLSFSFDSFVGMVRRLFSCDSPVVEVGHVIVLSFSKFELLDFLLEGQTSDGTLLFLLVRADAFFFSETNLLPHFLYCSFEHL